MKKIILALLFCILTVHATCNEMYEKFISYLDEKGFKTQHGIFGADMKVELLNDGPVTLLLDSKKLF